MNLTFLIHWAFLFFCCLWTTSSYAQSPLVLDEDIGEYALGNYLQVLEDPDGSWTIEEVIQKKSGDYLQRKNRGVPNFGYSSSVYWIKFVIENPTLEPQELLLAIEYPLHNDLELHFVDTNQNWHLLKDGNTRPYQREIKYRTPVFRLFVAANHSQTYFLRVQSENSIQLPLTLWKPIAFTNNTLTDQYYLGIYYGIIFIMALYNLFIFIQFKERAYLYYFLFIACYALYHLTADGLMFQFIWPNSPKIENFFLPMIVATVACITLQFTRNFLNFSNAFPKLDQLILLMIAIFALGIFLPLFTSHLFAISYVVGVASISAMVVFMIGIFCITKNIYPARQFVFTWGLFLVASSGRALMELGIIEYENYYIHFEKIGSIFVVIFLSLTLAVQMNKDRREKDLAQKEALGAKKEWEKAEQANQSKSQFLANMSHEIRTPLNAIVGFGQVLLSRAPTLSLPEDFIQYLKNIQISSLNLLGLINNILDLSKIESGKMETLIEGVALPQVLQEVYQITQVEALRKQQNYIFEVDANLPRVIATDRTKLTQILMNVVGNAIKFTPNEKEISLKAKQEGDSITIQVIDHGIGIPPEKKAAIFESFEQVDGSITRRFGGTGLGLTISKSLIELLKGEIEVSDTPGGGTTFTVKIPALEVPLSESLQESFTEVHFSPSNVVLLVEDNSMNQEMTKAVFEEIGLSLNIAQNGKEGIEKTLSLVAAGYPPDLILMDMHMPVMDGMEATIQMRSIPELDNIPIVALSADVFTEQKIGTLSNRLQGYLTKPIDLNQTLPVLKKYLRHEVNKKLGQEKESHRPTASMGNFLIDSEMISELKPQLRNQLIAVFFEQVPQSLEQIKEEIHSVQFKRMGDAAHHLKGSCSAIGALEMSELCQLIQSKGEQEDLTNIDSLIQQLESCYQKTKQELEKLIK